MKDWKDQLRDLKNALLGSGHDKERGDPSPKIDFEPPPAWLANGRSSPKKSLVQNPVAKPATPKPASMPVDNPSARPIVPPPLFQPHIEGGCSLNMPEWSNVGRSLQHPEHQGERSPPMTVRVGVDFGTAFTKVAIRAGVDLVPVDWSAVTGDDSEAGRYVVPGFIVRAPDGEFCWRRLAESDIQGNLKLPVIEKAGVNECPIATVAYLALVIRYARAFLYRNAEIGRKLVGRSLRWELNIGCPTEPHENPKIVAMFRRIARTAWFLAAEDQLAKQNVVAAWGLADCETDLEAEPGVVPEFVAQIAGYLGSPQVKEGLHALIDIGAATLDVATFKIERQDDVKALRPIQISFSAVRQFGTHFLRYNRYSMLGLNPSWNDAAPVECAEEFAQRESMPLAKVKEADGAFMKKVVHCIKLVVDWNRNNVRGVAADLPDAVHGYMKGNVWRDGLPVFITGGGARCTLYGQAVSNVERAIKSSLIQQFGVAQQFRFIAVRPTYAGARGIEGVDRLTVALGLTEDVENIARIVPHRDIEPITYGTRKRVDHTDLYGDR